VAIGTPVNRGTASTDTNQATLPVTTSGAIAAGSKIILSAGWRTASTLSSVSGGGLTWTIDRQFRNAGLSQSAALVTADAPSGLASGTTITLTFSANTTAKFVSVEEVTGLAAQGSVLDQQLGAENATTTTAFDTGNLGTTTVADELLVAVIFYQGIETTVTWASSFTALQRLTSPTRSMANGYRIVSATGVYKASGTHSPTSTWTGVLASYKAAGGPSTVNGSAALTGAGTSTTAGTRIRSGAAALTGTGSQTAAGVRTRSGSAVLTGLGSSTSAGTRIRSGAAALTGAGSSTTAGTRIRNAASNLTGQGTLAAAGGRTSSGTAGLTGSGAVTATGTRRLNGTASLTGAGTLGASGGATKAASSNLTSTSLLAATGLRTTFASAALTSLGSSLSDGATTRYGQTSLASTSTLLASGQTMIGGSANLAGLGSLVIAGSDFQGGVGHLTGGGTLSALGGGVVYGEAHLVTPDPVAPVIVQRTVGGGIRVILETVIYGSAVLTATGTLSASGATTGQAMVDDEEALLRLALELL